MEHNEAFWSQTIEDFLLKRYSLAWEGKQEQTIDFGEALVRAEPEFGYVVRLCFDAVDGEKRLDDIIEHVKKIVPWSMWFIGPGSQPADLESHLAVRGFVRKLEFDGLVLDDLSIEIKGNPDVVIEPLSWDNADEYATRCTDSRDPRFHTYLRESAHRFLSCAHQQVQVSIARLEGEVAGYAVLRIEPDQVAHFCNALTVTAYRRRGVYSSLIAHRLSVARAAGCKAAAIVAQSHTSAPILIKRGFRPICHFLGLVQESPPTSHT